MVSAILLEAALAAAFLIALYLLALRFPWFGESLELLSILVVRPLVKSEWVLKEAGAYCYLAFEKSLNYPPGVTNDTWHGVLVIARLILFLVSSIILTADVYNTLQRLPLLFGGAGAVSLPGSFAIPSSLLFVCMSALYGSVLLECAVLPYGAGLFPRMTEKVKKRLSVLCASGFTLSVAFMVLFWVVSAYYISVDPSIPWWLALPTLALVGIITAGASVLSLWGLVVGLVGLASVVFWTVALLCSSLSWVCSLLPAMLDVLVVHLSDGEKTVYERYLPGLAWQIPATIFHKRSRLPLASSQEGDAIEGASVLSQPTENEVIAMSEQLVCLTLNGVLGSRLLPYVRASLAPVKHLIRSSGRVDTLSPRVAPVGLGVPVSPSALQRSSALSVKEQFDSMGNNIVEVHSPVRDQPAWHAHVCDCRTGLDAVQMLRDNKRRLPGITQVVVTAVTSADLANPLVLAFLSELKRLWQEGVIATTLLFDLSSELVRSLGEEKFFSYVGRLLSDLISSHLHSQSNLSSVALFDQVGHASPFVSVAIATAETVSGKTPLRGWFARLFTKKAVIAGSLEDMLVQALTVTKDVMTQPETQAWMQSVSPTLPRALVFDVPISLADKMFPHYEERNNQQVKEYSPNATTITISGTPVSPLRGSSSLFRVGVACLYPVTLPLVETSQVAESERTDERREKPVASVLPFDAVVTDANALKADIGALNGRKAVRRPRATTKRRTSSKKGK